MAGAWFTSPWTMPFCADADFLIAEIEGSDDYDGLIWAIPHLTDLPRAIVTTYDGLLVKDANGVTDKEATKARCKPIVDAGFWCQYEAYFMSQPDNTDADYCGFPSEHIAPVLGVKFNGKTLDEQKALQVPGYGLYLIENA